MQNNKKIPLQSLREEKYKSIICYPKYEQEQFKNRLEELKKLNIDTIEFKGQKTIHNIPVLGKGCVGIVVTAYRKGEKVALKIRRTDADRQTMQHEAEMLQKANQTNIGPQLLGITKNFLSMEYIEGILLPQWIKTAVEKNQQGRLRHVLHLALEQAWKLDKAGLDHGELSHAPKHIIIRTNDTICIIDFETASVSRQVSNVTSICQYLFIGSSTAKLVQRKLGNINKNDLLGALRTYKEKKTKKNFENILLRCGLGSSDHI